MPALDFKRLAAEISVQHGIRVDPDDPMMAVVTLNRLMLEQTVGELVEKLHSATSDLHDAAEKVQLRAGIRLAKDVRECVTAIRNELRERVPVGDVAASGPRAHSLKVASRRLAVEVVAAALVFAAGVFLGASVRNW